jgi:hypothetical protein
LTELSRLLYVSHRYTFSVVERREAARANKILEKFLGSGSNKTKEERIIPLKNGKLKEKGSEQREGKEHKNTKKREIETKN